MLLPDTLLNLPEDVSWDRKGLQMCFLALAFYRSLSSTFCALAGQGFGRRVGPSGLGDVKGRLVRNEGFVFSALAELSLVPPASTERARRKLFLKDGGKKLASGNEMLFLF